MLLYVIGRMVKFNKKNFVSLQSRIFCRCYQIDEVFYEVILFFGKIKVETCINEEKEEIFEQLSISAIVL